MEEFGKFEIQWRKIWNTAKLRGAFVARSSCGLFPVCLQAVIFVHVISLKYNESRGVRYVPVLLLPIRRVKSFPFDWNLGFLTEGSPDVDGMAPSSFTFPCLAGEPSGVVWTLVCGVELNSESFSTNSESEQPVRSSVGATNDINHNISPDPHNTHEINNVSLYRSQHQDQSIIPVWSIPNMQSSTCSITTSRNFWTFSYSFHLGCPFLS